VPLWNAARPPSLGFSVNRGRGPASARVPTTLPTGCHHAMMGTKTRAFSPLPRDVSLEDLVPEEDFYRRLEAALDLSFVRELVAPLYAGEASLRWTRSSSSSCS
jgi:hypothetical protein